MRTLLRFIQRYSNLLLFLLLETVAVIFLVQGSQFQRMKIVSLNRQVSGFVYSKVDGIREYLSLKEANEQISLENHRLREEIDQFRSMVDSSVVRTSILGNRNYRYIPARVVRNSVQKQYNYITIDRGRNQGVFRDMGVIGDNGLVGIVMESSANFSTVIPAINRDFRLSVKLKSNNYAGILRWEGDSPYFASLNEIPYHVELEKGDTIVTSGFSSIFPEGIRVGIVESYIPDQGNFHRIRVRLFTSYQNLFHVNIIRSLSSIEQLDLENKIP